MTDQLADAAYLGAIILFILALGGLSNQETARRGNFYGMLGMGIALIAAVAGIKGNYAVLVGTLSLGGVVGFVLARRVQMTQMPELVAILHSLVGLAAVLVGFASGDLAAEYCYAVGRWHVVSLGEAGAPPERLTDAFSVAPLRSHF